MITNNIIQYHEFTHNLYNYNLTPKTVFDGLEHILSWVGTYLLQVGTYLSWVGSYPLTGWNISFAGWNISLMG